MDRRDCRELLELRVRREAQALDVVAERRGQEQRAAALLDQARSRLDAEAQRQRQVADALYHAIQGRRLAPERLMRLNDVIAAEAARVAARRRQVAQAAAIRAEAEKATEKARQVWRISRDAAERLRLLDGRLGAAAARRAEMLGEVEADDATRPIRLTDPRDHA